MRSTRRGYPMSCAAVVLPLCGRRRPEDGGHSETELIDSKAKRVLFDAYWSAKGWNVLRKEPNPDDFAYATAAGVMFDAEVLTHDRAVERVIAARSAADLTAIANAFVASLGARRVHLRPALGLFCRRSRFAASIRRTSELRHVRPVPGMAARFQLGQLRQVEMGSPAQASSLSTTHSC